MNIPNMLTIVRICLIPVFVALYIVEVPVWPLWAGLVFIAASFTDWLDGYLARKWKQITNFGKFMDPIADKLLVMAALLLLLHAGMLGDSKIGLLSVIILLAREFIISGFRLVAVEKRIVIAADKSGKLKTAAQMIAIVLLLMGRMLLGEIGFNLGLVLLYASVFLSVYSCIEYFIKNKNVLKDNV